ncbi:hypothetical protein H4582DRAFT_2147456 [Lactarius indigo]|nr:hypothetical protein H4582DRAFT_2147456 [Lactarius indigo]
MCLFISGSTDLGNTSVTLGLGKWRKQTLDSHQQINLSTFGDTFGRGLLTYNGPRKPQVTQEPPKLDLLQGKRGVKRSQKNHELQNEAIALLCNQNQQNLNNPQKESAIFKQLTTPVNKRRRLTEQAQDNAMTQNLKNPTLNELSKQAQPYTKPTKEHWIEKHDSDKEEQRTDMQASMNASSITKNHLLYANPESRPTASWTEARYEIPGPNSKTDHCVEEVIRLPNKARLPKENGPTRTVFRNHADCCQLGHNRTKTEPHTHEPSRKNLHELREELSNNNTNLVDRYQHDRTGIDSCIDVHDATRLVNERDGESTTWDHTRSMNFESQLVTSQPEARRDPRSEILITDSETRTRNLCNDELLEVTSPETSTNEVMLHDWQTDAEDTIKKHLPNLYDRYVENDQVEARVESLHEETHRTTYLKQTNQNPCRTMTCGGAPNNEYTDQIRRSPYQQEVRGDALNDQRISRSPCDGNTRGDAPNDQIIMPDETVRRNTNKQCLEALDKASSKIPGETREDELPWITISRRSRNGPTRTKKTSSTITPVKAVKLYKSKETLEDELPPATMSGPPQNNQTIKTPRHEQHRQEKRCFQCKRPGHQIRECPAKRMSTEQVATEIRRMNAATRRKTIVRMLEIDEVTLKQIMAELQKKLEDRDIEIDKDTLTKAITTCKRLCHNTVAMLDLRTADRSTNHKKEEKLNLEQKLCELRPIVGISEASSQRDDVTFAHRERAQYRSPTYTTPPCVMNTRGTPPTISRNNKETPKVERYSTLQRGTRVDTIVQQCQKGKGRKSLRERYADQTITPLGGTEWKFPPRQNDDHVTTSIPDGPTLTPDGLIYSLNELGHLNNPTTGCFAKTMSLQISVTPMTVLQTDKSVSDMEYTYNRAYLGHLGSSDRKSTLHCTQHASNELSELTIVPQNYQTELCTCLNKALILFTLDHAQCQLFCAFNTNKRDYLRRHDELRTFSKYRTHLLYPWGSYSATTTYCVLCDTCPPSLANSESLSWMMKCTTSFDILLSIAHSHPFDDQKETPTITPFPPPSPFDCSRYACYYEPLALLHTLACWCHLLVDTWYSWVIILADPHRRQAPRLTLTNYDLHQYHNRDTNLLTVHLPRHLVLTPPNADILMVVVPSSSLLLATDLTATVDIHSLHHPAHVTAAPRFYGDHLVIADDPLLRRGVIQSLHDSITTKHPGKDKKPLTLQ